MDCAYLSVNRVNGIGENSQLRVDCIVRHPFHTTCLSAVIYNRHVPNDNRLIIDSFQARYMYCDTRHDTESWWSKWRLGYLTKYSYILCFPVGILAF